MKSKPEQLAIFSSEPAFAEKLHVGRPNICNREALLTRFNDMLDRRWLSNNGPYVQEFEQRLKQALGVRHCIPVCNATVAIEIVARALGLHGEVIIPSLTFIATAHALKWQEIEPVFCDVDPVTHNLDVAQVERLITPRTTGIMGVHLWGRPCPVDDLTVIAKRHGLKLIFDAAHAFGCSHGGQMIGNFGDAEVFSFHATKFLNTFEGGAIATNSDELAAKIRLMKNFGFAGFDNVIYIGTNGKMTEVCAAMGLSSLEALDDLLAVNLRNYRDYRSGLEGIPGLRLLPYPEQEKCNYQYIVIEYDEQETQLKRDNLIHLLWAENIVARRYFYPGCHRMEPYNTEQPDVGLRLQQTEEICRKLLILPTGTAVGRTEIDLICSIIRTAVLNAAVINQRLAT